MLSDLECDSDEIPFQDTFDDVSEPGSPLLPWTKCSKTGGDVTSSLLKEKSRNASGGPAGKTPSRARDDLRLTSTPPGSIAGGLSLRASASKTPFRASRTPTTAGQSCLPSTNKTPSRTKTVSQSHWFSTEKTPSRPIGELSNSVYEPEQQLSSRVSASDVIAALGEVTNTLHQVVDHLDKQESQLKSLEKKVSSTTSSSSESGKTPKVPSIVRVSD